MSPLLKGLAERCECLQVPHLLSFNSWEYCFNLLFIARKQHKTPYFGAPKEGGVLVQNSQVV